MDYASIVLVCECVKKEKEFLQYYNSLAIRQGFSHQNDSKKFASILQARLWTPGLRFTVIP